MQRQEKLSPDSVDLWVLIGLKQNNGKHNAHNTKECSMVMVLWNTDVFFPSNLLQE